jgi:hypothetical protein
MRKNPFRCREKRHARLCWNYLPKKTPARFWLALHAGPYFFRVRMGNAARALRPRTGGRSQSID